MKLYRTRKIHAILAIFLAMTLIIPQMALADTSSTVTDQLGTVSQTVYGDQSSTVSGTVYGDLPGDTSEAANDEQTGSVSQAADEGQSVVDKVYNAVGNTPLTVSITKAVLPDGNVISDGQSVTAGSKITVYASVYGENIIQISFECKFGNSVQEVVYSVENGYYKTLHQPTLPGAHEMMVSARDSEGNEVTDSLSMMVKTPQVIFTAGDSEANADTDKVYYNRKSGNNDVLSFELSGLAPGVPYAVEFGYIEDETFTVSGAV